MATVRLGKVLNMSLIKMYRTTLESVGRSLTRMQQPLSLLARLNNSYLKLMSPSDGLKKLNRKSNLSSLSN